MHAATHLDLFFLKYYTVYDVTNYIKYYSFSNSGAKNSACNIYPSLRLRKSQGLHLLTEA